LRCSIRGTFLETHRASPDLAFLSVNKRSLPVLGSHPAQPITPWFAGEPTGPDDIAVPNEAFKGRTMLRSF
jgi:hypothetical protein